MEGIGFQGDDKRALYPIATDAAALHVTAFAVEEFISRVLRGRDTINPVATSHLQKGLRLLRERLLAEDDDTRISDSTISVVLKLASAAHFEGDSIASRNHMEGLCRMVELRGGVPIFDNDRFVTEMVR